MRGFTLIEASIALVVGGLMLTSTLHVIQLERAQQVVDINVKRIEAIKTALAGYAGKNGRLPCPAAQNQASAAVNYGKAVTGCEEGAAITGTNASQNMAGPGLPAEKWVRVGAVPVRDLGLPKEYMTDSWGRLFSYAVTGKLTATVNPLPAPRVELVYKAPILPPRNPPQFNKHGPAPASPGNVLYVILSHGPDMAYSFSTEGAGPDCATATGSSYDRDNCGGDFSFTKAPVSTRSGISQHFDDIVEFATTINEPFLAPPFCSATQTIHTTDGINFSCQERPRLPGNCAGGKRLTSNDGLNYGCQDTPGLPPTTCAAGDGLRPINSVTFGCQAPLPANESPVPPTVPNCGPGRGLISTDGSTLTCKDINLSSAEQLCAAYALGGGWFGCTATCPAGMTATGGGFYTGKVYSDTGRALYRNGNGFFCKFKPTDCSTGALVNGCDSNCASTCVTVN